MRILITAGGTREYIDPVRFISNASSGKMGYALAKKAAACGHEVTLISAPVALKCPAGVDLVKVVTSEDMFGAVKARYENCDCLIMAAAVSDYKPAQQHDHKIKKSDAEMVIHLKPTTDILKWAGGHKTHQMLIGFALESRDIHHYAEAKLAAKRADMIVANSPAAIGSDKSAIEIKMVGCEWISYSPAAKHINASRILNAIETLAAEKS